MTTTANSVQQKKRRLRRRIRWRMNTMATTTRRNEERRLIASLKQDDKFAAAKAILAYHPMDSEPSILPTLISAGNRGAEIYLPRINGGMLDFLRWKTLDLGELEKSKYGISAPPENASSWTRAAEESIIIVPGLGFTPGGWRMGRGKGYYDRFLADHLRLYSVALCFSRQVHSRLPVEDGDVALMRIIHPQ